MFVCDECCAERAWPTAPAITLSFGRCEMCERETGCSDLRSDVGEMPPDDDPRWGNVRNGYKNLMMLTALQIWGEAAVKEREIEVRGEWGEWQKEAVKVWNQIGPVLKQVDTESDPSTPSPPSTPMETRESPPS